VEDARRTSDGKKNSKYCVPCKIPQDPDLICLICNTQMKKPNEDQCCSSCMAKLKKLRQVVLLQVQIQDLDRKININMNRISVLTDKNFSWTKDPKKELSEKRQSVVQLLSKKQIAEGKLDMLFQSIQQKWRQ
jgi:hypothetical protein